MCKCLSQASTIPHTERHGVSVPSTTWDGALTPHRSIVRALDPGFNPEPGTRNSARQTVNLYPTPRTVAIRSTLLPSLRRRARM